MSSRLRQRRYVSAPAGSYPEPVPPREQRSAGAVAAVGVADEAAAAPPDEAPLASQAARSGPGLEAIGTPVALPSAHFPDPEMEDDSKTATRGRRRARSPLAGMMLGGLLGLALGVLAGLLLLALTEGDGTWSQRLADFGVLYQQISDPAGLWAAVGDPLIRMSAVLVAAGFLLLGVGWGGRIGGSRS